MSAQDWLQIFDGSVTLLAAVIAGTWAFIKIRRRREHFPRIEFTVDVDFVAVQNERWIVSLNAFVVNKGVVRYEVRDFQFDARYASRSDLLEEGGPDINFQTYVPRLLKEGSWLGAGSGSAFVDPGLQTRYSYISSVPCEASLLLLHGRVGFRASRKWYVHTADKNTTSAYASR